MFIPQVGHISCDGCVVEDVITQYEVRIEVFWVEAAWDK